MIQPERHNPQTQPITVALSNICRDYPAGGVVLRELLQNADDAGASSVRFVLDQSSYPTTTLVHTGVAEYQGPALLAYNDATFSEEDFGSLSRIGDSRKLQDGSTTGRFGRGFNAVYNWTDSPSVLSGNSLLILDPHEWWTSEFKNPGGPIYDFVKNSKDGSMEDQMAAFSAITRQFDQAFHGTIIRIPLRTSEQAKKSKICPREENFSKIAQILKTFADEFGHTGLLFMKNVSQISIVVGDSPAISIRIANEEQVRSHKLQINAEIKKTIKEGGCNFDSSFEVEILSGALENEQKYRFAIHHSVKNYPDDESLRSWSRNEALVPWVAVASEIGAKDGERNGGLLFNVLPSQIRINQPVHIHSCFSMSPDRSRLHKIGDSSVQYPLPGRWNHWLFESLIPQAWAKLLLHVAQKYPHQSAFESWPMSQENTTDILCGVDKTVLRFIQDRDLKVWYTDVGYVTRISGLVSETEVSSVTRAAFKEAGVPVIYLPDDLLSSVKTACQMKYLTPRTLCDYLGQEQERLRIVSEESKGAILGYAISDAEFRGYGAIEIFPFEDSTYKAIDNHVAFIHRNRDEQNLFHLGKDHNIDSQRLPEGILDTLRKGCSSSSLHPSLRLRSPCDLKSYCLQTHFKTHKPNNDIISVDENTVPFISKAWDWIIARKYNILDDNISCLWFLPLSNGKYRRIKPVDPSAGTIFAGPDELGCFLRSLSEIIHVSNKPIIREKFPSSHSLKLLTYAMKDDWNLFIKSSNSLEDFILWLGEIREVLERVPDSMRYDIHKLLASRISQFSGIRDSSAIQEVLRGMKIFEKLLWKSENNDMVLHRTYVSLKDHHDIIGLRTIEPLPNIGDVTFLNAESNDTQRLLNYFKLAKFLPPLELVKRFMIPFWWDPMAVMRWTPSAKEKVTESILQNFFSLDDNSRTMIKSLAMIPVERFRGERAGRFATARELIDPSPEKLRGYFFENEDVYPADWVSHQYGGVLKECGLRTELDADLVLDRAKCFAKRTAEVQETSERAQRLLLSSPAWGTELVDQEILTLRELRWLPVLDSDSSLTFKNAKECRGLEEKVLVGYVLPTLDFGISPDWQKHLGWDCPIPHVTLLKQLEYAIQKADRRVVDAVLTYLNRKDQVSKVRQELIKLPLVAETGGLFVPVQKAFKSGCGKLHPYFYNVDHHFGIQHKSLLKKLGVPEKPTPKDLLGVQDQLLSQNKLSEGDIPVAIEICKLASTFSESDRSSFKVLDGTGVLRAIEDITFNDLLTSSITGTFNCTHPDIPQTVIEALRIEPLSSRVRRGQLGIEDDEFDQHEDTVTAISDILTRYSVESTFKEFLANADDCKTAKELNWLLDKREHSKNRLLTEALGEFQGPALLVHNDGVFEDEHFKGLSQIGRGSKTDDATTIGKFGRGSLTMYHWTDVPMLLSGEWLVILDPQRKFLDLKPGTGQKYSGVKIKISKLKVICKDQLTPFENLWGFSQDLDHYPGTIFRFPLRRLTTQSNLMGYREPLDSEATRKFLDNFLEKDGRMSLLFLRRIKYMDFKIYGDKEPRWTIHSEKYWHSSGWTTCTITKCTDQKSNYTFKDRWRVGIQDLTELEEGESYFPARHKSRRKDIECGIAALISEPEVKQKPILAASPIPKYFSNLPLPFLTDLPVHIHATFLLASDRASIPVEDSMQEDGAKWNRWLFSYAIPCLYLHFLEDLGRQTQWVKDPFPFWPQDRPSKKHISEPVYDGFWRMLANSTKKLFPTTRHISAARMGQRRPPELVEVKEAVFDILPCAMSIPLGDVLETQVLKLVRPGQKIGGELQQRMEIESVTPKRLREILKSDKASKALEQVARKTPEFLEALLDLVTPENDDGFTELDGCRILPLADNTLGTLRIDSVHSQADQYFLASQEERQLFNFASKILVKEEQGKKFTAAVLNYHKEFKNAIPDNKFNITRITLNSMGNLLGCGWFGDKNPKAEMDSWLSSFWCYCHAMETSQSDEGVPFTSRLDIRDYPIFKATCDGIESYIEPMKLDILPCVVEPDNSKQRSLCRKFPGIYIFDCRLMPKCLQKAEKSFNIRASFNRFVTSISKLAIKENISLEVYIKKYLDNTEKKLLQDLVVQHLVNENMDSQIKSLLSFLPIWPTIQSLSWISSSMALVTPNFELLVPWMIGYDLFIDRETYISRASTLRGLGVNVKSGVELLSTSILPQLPSKLPPSHNYRSFIRALASFPDRQRIIGQLRHINLAPNRAMTLVPAYKLFDHDDKIFTSSFREEADSMFLLGDVEESKSFWQEIGLHHRLNGQFEPDDYIKCLMTMRRRLEGCKNQTSLQMTIEDARVVLEPLTTPSTALGRFSKQNWSMATLQAFFPATRDFQHQLPHRQEKMASVAENLPLLQLSQVISSQYLPICWSQISFPIREPTVTTFAQLESNGEPSTALVWKHLEYMASSIERLEGTEVAGFLSDIYKTYDFLQANLVASKQSFQGLKGAQFWFNLEVIDTNLISTADLVSCRCSIENLILESSCDTKNLKSVGQALLRYQNLLRELGCKSIVYPVVQTLKTRTEQRVSDRLKKLKNQEVMLDLTLETGGESIRAHKVVMAAASDFFIAHFRSHWLNQDVIDLKPFSHFTISVVVEFAYSGAYDWKSIQVQDSENDNMSIVKNKLDDWLDLLEAANYLLMPALKEEVENQIMFLRKSFIREHNVLGVLKRASDARAFRVKEYCDEFYASNKEAVDLAVEE